MYSKFTSTLLQKILAFLRDHPNLFEDKEKKALDALQIPESFINYLKQTNEKEFFKDLTLATKFANGEKKLKLNSSDFFKALNHFLITDFARKLDLLDSDYYLYTRENRHKIAEKLISGQSPLAESLRQIIIHHTYQQIATETQKLSRQVGNKSFILIQSPIEITPELKKEIRQQIRTKKPQAFPIFQINKKLIGGIRIFQDGESEDLSWLSRVLNFTSLTSA